VWRAAKLFEFALRGYKREGMFPCPLALSSAERHQMRKTDDSRGDDERRNERLDEREATRGREMKLRHARMKLQAADLGAPGARFEPEPRKSAGEDWHGVGELQ
jgi:hypothetical protein